MAESSVPQWLKRTRRAPSAVRSASAKLLANTLREIPVVDGDGQVLALLDEMDIAQWHMNAATSVSRTPVPLSRPIGERR